MNAFSALRSQSNNSDFVSKESDYVRGYRDGITATMRLTHETANEIVRVSDIFYD